MNLGRRRALRNLAQMGVGSALALLHPARAEARIRGVAGKVYKRGAPDYELQRQALVWHLSKPERFPARIVRAQSEADVVATVHYARRSARRIALRSSGHNGACVALRDAGIALDLGALRSLRIDASGQRARVGPAVWSQDLWQALTAQGRAFPVAHCGPLALGGYLIGGGLGWNHDEWGGIASQLVRRMRVVTADGRARWVDETSEPELFWAARGAGPGLFAAVTEFEIETPPAPGAVLAVNFVHPLARAGEVAQWLETPLAATTGVESLGLMMHAPNAPPGATPDPSLICFVGLIAYARDAEAARAKLAPFLASPLATQAVFKTEPAPFTAEQMFAPQNVAGDLGRYAVDNLWTDQPVPVVEALAAAYARAPSPRGHVVFTFKNRIPSLADSAFSTAGRLYCAAYAVWDDPAADADNRAWLRTSLDAVNAYATGHYVNELDNEGAPQRVRRAYSAAAWERLRALRRTHDPDRIFEDYLGYDA